MTFWRCDAEVTSSLLYLHSWVNQTDWKQTGLERQNRWSLGSFLETWKKKTNVKMCWGLCLSDGACVFNDWYSAGTISMYCVWMISLLMHLYVSHILSMCILSLYVHEYSKVCHQHACDWLQVFSGVFVIGYRYSQKCLWLVAGVFGSVCRWPTVCLWSHAAGYSTCGPTRYQKDGQGAPSSSTKSLWTCSWYCHVQAPAYWCRLGNGNSIQGLPFVLVECTL